MQIKGKSFRRYFRDYCNIFEFHRNEEAFRPDIVFNPYIQRMFQVDISHVVYFMLIKTFLIVYCSTCCIS